MGLFSKLTGMVINNTNSTALNTMNTNTLQALIIFYFVFIGIALVVAYIYTSLAYSRLAKKTRTEPRWLVWIPFFRYYTVSKMAKMHWWPMLFAIPLALAIPLFFISKVNCTHLFCNWDFLCNSRRSFCFSLALETF